MKYFYYYVHREEKLRELQSAFTSGQLHLSDLQHTSEIFYA